MDSEVESDSNTPTKPFKCRVKDCLASFTKNSKLQIHLRKHTGERPFECDVPGCDKTYTNSSHLRRHKTFTHSEKKDLAIICRYEGCGLQLSNKFSLKKHYARKHDPENMPFKCAICHDRFHRKKLLQQHFFIHTGLPPFKCNKCTMGFLSEALLKKHLRSHQTYKCACGEVFHRWSLMQAHKRECKHKKEYACDICNKVFLQLSNLKTHKLVHLDKDEKPVFKCTVEGCLRSYFFKKNLTSHMNTCHKNREERPKFPCTRPNCNKVLQTKRCLKNHLEWHSRPKYVTKQRNPRSDKGLPRKSMASFLAGLNALDNVNNKTLAKSEETLTIKQLQKNATNSYLKKCSVIVSRINVLTKSG